MTISVNCMTRGPAARVAAMLGLLRPVVDEIVVAVDDRADEDVAQSLRSVSDRVILYPYAEPVDRPLAWLHSVCSGGWVLTMDDDELPSAALLQQLPALTSDERVTHVWLPRRWLFPNPERYLDAPPWRPDYLARLVRNDRRVLRFPTETHRPIEVAGPGLYAEAPIYHLDCVLNTRAQREAKARRYERYRPGKRVAGLPLNVAFYVPERLPAPPTAPVPAPDLELVDSVLAGDIPAGPPTAAVERTTRAEVDALWEGRPLAPTDYRARVELAESPAPFRAGEARTLDVRVTNLGGATWPACAAHPEIRVVARWPEVADPDELRTELPHELAPGESALVPAQVAAPMEPGRSRLVIDLVHEHVRWFDCGVETDVHVVPQRRAMLAGGSPAEVERLGADEPETAPVLLSTDPAALRGVVAAPVVPSARAYLLDGLPRRRPLAAAVLAARCARLLWAAAATRRGGTAELPRGARDLLETIALPDKIAQNPNPPATRRDALVERVTRLAARLSGTAVTRLP